MLNSLTKLLVQIKNAQLNKYSFFIFLKKTKICMLVLSKLVENGLVLGFYIQKNKVKIYLKYVNNRPVINFIKKLTFSNKNFYLNRKQISKIKNFNCIILIILTNKGLKTLLECKKLNIGGLALFLIF